MLKCVIGTTIQLADREIAPIQYGQDEQPYGHVIVMPPTVSSDVLDWMYKADEAKIAEAYPGCTAEHLGAFADGST